MLYHVTLNCIALHYTTHAHTHTHCTRKLGSWGFPTFLPTCTHLCICTPFFRYHSCMGFHGIPNLQYQLFVLLIDLKRGWFISPGGVDRCAPYCAILSMDWSLMEVWTRFRSCRVGQLQPLQTPWRPLFKFLFRRHFCNLLYESWTDGECVQLAR